MGVRRRYCFLRVRISVCLQFSQNFACNLRTSTALVLFTIRSQLVCTLQYLLDTRNYTLEFLRISTSITVYTLIKHLKVHVLYTPSH